MRFSIVLLFTLALVALAPLVRAQDGAPLTYGDAATGTLDADTPVQRHTFDGLRGEVVSLTLSVTGGDLDPVLTVLAPDGTPLAVLDDGNARGGTLPDVRLAQSGPYTVAVTRFGGPLGSTAGDYTLTLNRVGTSSASGSALRYGDSIINAVTPEQPQLFYPFSARAGDIVNITLRRISGDLDPYLLLTDGQGVVLAEADDTPGSGTLDAMLTEYLFSADGTYIIVATRYGGERGGSTGGFVLSLDTASGSGAANSARTALPLRANVPVRGELTADRYEQFYTFTAARDDIITLRMTRADGSVDPFLSLRDADGNELASNDDSDGSQNATIADFIVPTTGTYTVVATRYQGAEGTTVGTYQLELTTQGSAFDVLTDDLPVLRYNTTVGGTLNERTPAVDYAFRGAAGDVLSITLLRATGDLDPVLSVLNADGTLLAQDDDSAGERNARLARFVVPADGVYVVRAARFAPTEGTPATSGTFTLSLAQLQG